MTYKDDVLYSLGNIEENVFDMQSSLTHMLREIKDIDEDVTDNFVNGADLAYNICMFLHIKIAILKERSPSCGVHKVYDGTFSHTIIPGMGVTAALLKRKGITVYSEDEIPKLLNDN